MSSFKSLEQFSAEFTWGHLSKGYCQFVQMVPRHWTRWPPCPYMVKTFKNFLLQNQESFGAESVYSIEDSRSTKFVQMITLGCPLIFLRQGQICVPIHLYGENVEKSFSQNVLKALGWNLQCRISVVKHFSYNQKFVPRGLSALAMGYIHV